MKNEILLKVKKLKQQM